LIDRVAVAYPPYNIEKTGEDAYRLTMAVAGFSPAELDITVQENTLLVTGKAQKEDENGGAYLHRGIARRTFERRFSLADHMKVVGALCRRGSRSARGGQAAQDQDRHCGRDRATAGDGAKGATAGDRAKGGLISTSKGSARMSKRPRISGAFCFSVHKSAEQEGARSPTTVCASHEGCGRPQRTGLSPSLRHLLKRAVN